MDVPARVAERAHSRWTRNESGCHISAYSVQSRDGQIVGELDVDHRDPDTCDKRCVNVDHLRLLTPEQNRRRQGRKYPLGFCGRGHPDSERVPNHRGAMICPTCKREQTRESAIRVRARKLAAA